MIAGRLGPFRVLYLTQDEVDELALGVVPLWIPGWALGLQVQRVPSELSDLKVFVPDGYSHIAAVRDQ